MFQLRQLKVFLAAAQTLSFTAAAKRVHLSQPSVTEQVQALEQSVGQKLFIRNNNRLVLTPAGERLAVRARELLAMAEDTLNEIRDHLAEPLQTIRVAAPQTLCTSLLVPLLADYADLRPGAQFVMQERNSAATAQAVLDGTADIGLVHGWPVNSAGLRASLVARDEPVVVMAAGHPLCSADQVHPEDLARFPLLVTTQGCRYREYLELLLQQAPVRPSIRGTGDSVFALVQMVSQGLGISVLPKMAVDGAARHTPVELRPLSTTREGLPICFITQDREPSAALAQLMRMGRLVTTGSDEPVPALHV